MGCHVFFVWRYILRRNPLSSPRFHHDYASYLSLCLSLSLMSSYALIPFQHGDTALACAAFAGHATTVELLLRPGADLEAKNNVKNQESFIVFRCCKPADFPACVKYYLEPLIFRCFFSPLFLLFALPTMIAR